jgi:hypothetical protein
MKSRRNYPLPDEFEDPLSNYEPRVYADELEEALVERTVGDMQIRPYAEVSPQATVGNALQALAGLKIASLMVVEQGRLAGLFTERDALERVAGRMLGQEAMPVALIGGGRRDRGRAAHRDSPSHDR